jgi:hypothetical protein
VFRVTELKQQKIAKLTRQLLCEAARSRRWLRARSLASFTGLCQAVHLAVPPARFFLRSIHECLATRGSWNGKVRMTRQALRDMEWWLTLPTQHNQQHIWRPPETAVLHCDASDYAWGGVLNSRKEARGFFSREQQQKHITLKELQAVRFTVQSFVHHLAGRRVLLWEDNRAVMHVLTNLTSKSPELMRELRKLWWILDVHDIRFRVKYIRSAANTWADRLSRLYDNQDWKLNPALFNWADRRWGPHTIDRFGTYLNRQTPRYNSQWHDPLTEGVDALSLEDEHWQAENNWINPPWDLLDEVVQKLRQSGSTATVITPCWEGAAWHQQLQELATEIFTLEPHRDLFFPGRHGSCAGIGPPGWGVSVFRLEGHQGGSTAQCSNGNTTQRRSKAQTSGRQLLWQSTAELEAVANDATPW